MAGLAGVQAALGVGFGTVDHHEPRAPTERLGVHRDQLRARVFQVDIDHAHPLDERHAWQASERLAQ